MDHRVKSGGDLYADDLTWREQEVLILLSDHLSNREIAERLHLAESTVKDYVSRILAKLYVQNRRQAVERASALGLSEAKLPSTVLSPSNLPAEGTVFIGRRTELEQIRQSLMDARLLTLTGPGGIGKTRLALKAAEGVSADFRDGRYFVSLAPIRSVSDIIQTITESIKFPLATHEDPLHQLLRYLKKRQLLLVMDNFEHLLDGAGIISQMLQAAPEVKILATLREKLNLQSETILNITGMAFPEHVSSSESLDYDAITMFLQSARKLRPGLNPSHDELSRIAEICQIVDGMPLAIELAAAWLQILNVDEIVEELKKGLDILAIESRDLPERHRSIQAVFDHSWTMLDSSEQDVFMRLTVFRGGFTREAVQHVTGTSLKQLAGLVNKSLVKHDPDSSRFEVHELLRQHGQKRLERSPQASISALEAHAAYYAQFMKHRGLLLRGHQQMLALEEIEADIENIRAAWDFYLESKNASQMWLFILGLWHVYWIRWWNHAGMQLFAQAVEALQDEQDPQAEALQALSKALQAYFMAWLGLADQGYQLAQEGIDVLQQFNHPEALAIAYDSLIVNAYLLNRYADEIRAIDQMLAIAKAYGDKWLLNYATFAASMGALITEDYDEAEQLAESNLIINEQTGDLISSTMPLIVQGHVALARGKLEKARAHYLHCLELSESIGFYYSSQTASKYLSKVALAMGDKHEAEIYLVQCMTITKETGFLRDIINLLYEFACLMAAQGHSEHAVELLALVVQHPASQQTRWLEGPIIDSAKELLTRLEQELPTGTFEQSFERGQSRDLEEVIANLIDTSRRG